MNPSPSAASQTLRNFCSAWNFVSFQFWGWSSPQIFHSSSGQKFQLNTRLEPNANVNSLVVMWVELPRTAQVTLRMSTEFRDEGMATPLKHAGRWHCCFPDIQLPWSLQSICFRCSFLWWFMFRLVAPPVEEGQDFGAWEFFGLRVPMARVPLPMARKEAHKSKANSASFPT